MPPIPPRPTAEPIKAVTDIWDAAKSIAKLLVGEGRPTEPIATEAVAHDSTKESTVYDFEFENGRLPKLGDPVPPWLWKAWLLPYVQGIHAAGYCGNRWGYQIATLAKGSLLDEPIPRVEFDKPDNSVTDLLDSWCSLIGSSWSDFTNLVDWLCWGLGLSASKSELDDSKQEKLYRTVNIGPLLATPYDYLGRWIESQGPQRNKNAFFATPHHICAMMVDMQFKDEEGDLRTKSVCDPCSGSGRLLLHAANYSLRLFGQDIDALLVACSKINFALYAPWGAFPMPYKVLGVDPPAPPEPPAPPPVKVEMTCDKCGTKVKRFPTVKAQAHMAANGRICGRLQVAEENK